MAAAQNAALSDGNCHAADLCGLVRTFEQELEELLDAAGYADVCDADA